MVRIHSGVPQIVCFKSLGHFYPHFELLFCAIGNESALLRTVLVAHCFPCRFPTHAGKLARAKQNDLQVAVACLLLRKGWGFIFVLAGPAKGCSFSDV